MEAKPKQATRHAQRERKGDLAFGPLTQDISIKITGKGKKKAGRKATLERGIKLNKSETKTNEDCGERAERSEKKT